MRPGNSIVNPWRRSELEWSLIHQPFPQHVAIRVHYWIFPPGNEPREYTAEITPDRVIVDVFNEIVASVRGTDDEIPVDDTFELDGKIHRSKLNWELAIPITKDRALVVFDDNQDASVRREIVDMAHGYDQMIIPPGATCSSCGLPEGVLIMVEDWTPLSPPTPSRSPSEL